MSGPHRIRLQADPRFACGWQAGCCAAAYARDVEDAYSNDTKSPLRSSNARRFSQGEKVRLQGKSHHLSGHQGISKPKLLTSIKPRRSYRDSRGSKRLILSRNHLYQLWRQPRQQTIDVVQKSSLSIRILDDFKLSSANLAINSLTRQR